MASRPAQEPQTITVILTVKNDASGCAQTLESLVQQTRAPDEIIIVDGGSTDCTCKIVHSFEARLKNLHLYVEPGLNIAEGRQVATRRARGTIIASIDAGCRAQPDWLEQLIRPFESDEQVDVVAGAYLIEPQTLFEEVVGLATMRGQLSAVDPKTFNPSGRSMAYTKEVWKRAGGWPTWLNFSEDTLFAHRLRRVALGWHVALDAVVFWRPRTSWRKLGRQFYCYGTGRGHTQIGAADFAYNIRNLALIVISATAAFWTPWALLILGALLAYFYVYTFHDMASKIAGRTRTWLAYPLAISVMWVVMASNLAGYLRGTLQRLVAPRYRQRMEAYLAG